VRLGDRLRESVSFRRGVTRRGFLTVAVSAIVAGVVAGVGAYYAGTLAAPAEVTKEVTRTVERTTTVTAPATTVTKTVTTTVTTTPPPTTATRPMKNSIKIGIVDHLSGILKPSSEDQSLPVYYIWRDKVNAEGGIYVAEFGKKLPVEFVIYDDASDTSRDPLLTEKLIVEDKVDFVVLPWGTAWQLACVPVTEKYRYVTITTCEGADLTKLGFPAEYTFWEGPGRADRSVNTLIDLLNSVRERFQIKTVAVLTCQTDYTIDFTNIAVPLLEKWGYKIVYRTEYPMDIKDASPIASRLVELKPDAVLAFTYPDDCIVVHNAMLASKYTPKLLWYQLGPNLGFIRDAFGPKLERTLTMQWASESMNPKVIDWLSNELQTRFNIKYNYAQHALNLYQFEVLQQAIEKTGTLDHEKIKQVILTSEFDTIFGKIRIEKRQYGSYQYYVWNNPALIGQWQNGKFVAVAPESYREAECLPYTTPP
jgi:branched-chain amino acid transport system substrate-binding protein